MILKILLSSLNKKEYKLNNKDIIKIICKYYSITEEELNNGIVPSIQLEYTDLIRQYINNQKYESEKIKSGVLQEFNEIAKIYDEGYLE